MGVSPAEAEEVAQEVFIVIHARLHSLERPEALRSWIYGIARRVVSRHHRSQRSRAAHSSAFAAEPVVTGPPTPLENAEQNDKIRLLWSLLEKLDDDKREVFVMAELDELSVPEIAEILEIPLNTTYSRLRTARLAFQQALARRSSSQQAGGPCRT